MDKLNLNQKGYIITKNHNVCEAKIIGFLDGELVVNGQFSNGCKIVPPCEFIESEEEAYSKAVWRIKAELERCVAEIAAWNSRLDATKMLYGLKVQKGNKNKE